MIDPLKLQTICNPLIGRPYLFGAKWDVHSPDPEGPVDCSGFTKYVLFQADGLLLPDGAQEQFDCTELICLDEARPGDLGFLRKDGNIRHVGLIYNGNYMIEARDDDYNKVTLRPKANWLCCSEFTGFKRPKWS